MGFASSDGSSILPISTICTRLLIQRFEYDLNPLGSAFCLVFRGIRGVQCFSGGGGHRAGGGFLGTDTGGNTGARGSNWETVKRYRHPSKSMGNRQKVQGCRQKVSGFASKCLGADLEKIHISEGAPSIAHLRVVVWHDSRLPLLEGTLNNSYAQVPSESLLVPIIRLVRALCRKCEKCYPKCKDCSGEDGGRG